MGGVANISGLGVFDAVYTTVMCMEDPPDVNLPSRYATRHRTISLTLNDNYPRGHNSDAHSPVASKWQPVHLNNHPA